MTEVALENLGEKVLAAARLAVALHMGRRTDDLLKQIQGQPIVIGGAGPTFTEEPLPASIARRGRSSHNAGEVLP